MASDDQPLKIRGIEIPAGELDWRFTRSGGPGGQHANTSDTVAEVRFDVAGSPSLDGRQRQRITARLDSQLTSDGVLIIRAGDSRSQHRNRQIARKRLIATLHEALAPAAPRRRPTKPSKAAKRRRLENKRHKSQIKALRKRPEH